MHSHASTSVLPIDTHSYCLYSSCNTVIYSIVHYIVFLFQSKDVFLYFVVALFMIFFFFFQAEDGIRDADVTGVQTCALPIFHGVRLSKRIISARPEMRLRTSSVSLFPSACSKISSARAAASAGLTGRSKGKIGRASCRERV